MSEETEDDALAAPMPPTLRLVDAGLDHLYLPHCVDAEGIKFLDGIPKIGSCLICSLTPSSSPTSPAAILVCDTLSPPGSGSSISEVRKSWEARKAVKTVMFWQTDRCFLLRLSEITRLLMPRLLPASLHSEEEKATWLQRLQERIQALQAIEKADGDEDLGPSAENEQTEEKTEPIAETEVSEEIQALLDDVKVAETTVDRETAALTKEEDILAVVKESIGTERQRFLYYLRGQTQPPLQTRRLLHLVSMLLGECMPLSSSCFS